jgi:hypothetical protein
MRKTYEVQEGTYSISWASDGKLIKISDSKNLENEPIYIEAKVLRTMMDELSRMTNGGAL